MEQGITIHKPATQKEFAELNKSLQERGYIAVLPGTVKEVLNDSSSDSAIQSATDLACTLSDGGLSSGPLSHVAWSFDAQGTAVVQVSDSEGKDMGLGYVKWGPHNNIPSLIPALGLSLPYTAAPLRYIADLTAGLGPRLMYRFPDGTMVDYEDAGPKLEEILREAKASSPEESFPNPFREVDDTDSVRIDDDDAVKRAREELEAWKKTWYGYDVKSEDGKETRHVPGAKEFSDENNLDFHFTACEQDDVNLDIYFPTIGFEQGRSKDPWDPRIVKVDFLPAHSTRLERMNEYRHINHVYFSDQWRNNRAIGTPALQDPSTGKEMSKITMYPAAMPQRLYSDLRYIVKQHKKSRLKDRPTWVVCPTFYPSGQKPYYPQPAWWSIFLSKAFDFSSTILYDKAKARENKTTFGKIFYISLDYLDQVFHDEGLAGDLEKQRSFIRDIEQSMEDFLSRRENHGKMMRQWMWLGADGKEHENVKIVDVAETTKDETSAGKEELELSTSPIFLALQVDPRLVGVPMVHSSNGGTALREMHLLKQSQLSPKQRLYLSFLNIVPKFNGWHRAVYVIKQYVLSTLDRSKTGIVESVAGEAVD